MFGNKPVFPFRSALWFSPDPSIFPLFLVPSVSWKNPLKVSRKHMFTFLAEKFVNVTCQKICRYEKKKNVLWSTSWKSWKFLTIEVYWWELPRIWCRGEILKEPWCKSEGKSSVLNESIVNCAVNCVVCTSLYNFSSLSSRFIASGRRSNGVKLWYCLTKQPVCVSQGEVLAFRLVPGMQENPRKTNLSQIRRLLLNYQPWFWKKYDCPEVILCRHPDYSSHVTIHASKSEMRPRLAQTLKQHNSAYCFNWKEMTQQVRYNLHKLRRYKINILK